MKSLVGVEGHDLDLVLGDNFANKSRLVHDESSLELLDASFAGLDALFDGHISLVVLIENGVDKVAGVAMGTLGDLLECAKVVHPVELGLLLDLIVASHQNVHLEGSAGAKGRSHL